MGSPPQIFRFVAAIAIFLEVIHQSTVPIPFIVGAAFVVDIIDVIIPQRIACWIAWLTFLWAIAVTPCLRERVLATAIGVVLIDSQCCADGTVGVGGLILAKIPEETAEERNAYYEQQTENQMNAVDNNLMRENDPRMPISNERKSKVTFGASGKND